MFQFMAINQRQQRQCRRGIVSFPPSVSPSLFARRDQASCRVSSESSFQGDSLRICLRENWVASSPLLTEPTNYPDDDDSHHTNYHWRCSSDTEEASRQRRRANIDCTFRLDGLDGRGLPAGSAATTSTTSNAAPQANVFNLSATTSD